EAARGLGRSPIWVTATITLPLVAPGLLSGFALVFLTTMKELPATLLLAPIEYDTLASDVWRSANEAFFAQAAAPALMLILFAAVPMALIVGRENLRD
ncbi:MAG TPA: iron ABC transporter permease, partial [Dehalococcoidia bacterium]|nr:iron ABC transporter permease [Dehalococcoidia bacterium]